MDRIQSPIGSYPSDWNLAILNSVAELKHGYQFRTTDFTKEGIKVFKITQIKSNGVIDISSCDYIDKSRLEDFNRVIIQKGDIFLVKGESGSGKSTVVSLITGINKPINKPNKNKSIPRKISLSDCHFFCVLFSIMKLF